MLSSTWARKHASEREICRVDEIAFKSMQMTHIRMQLSRCSRFRVSTCRCTNKWIECAAPYVCETKRPPALPQNSFCIVHQILFFYYVNAFSKQLNELCHRSNIEYFCVWALKNGIEWMREVKQIKGTRSTWFYTDSANFCLKNK